MTEGAAFELNVDQDHSLLWLTLTENFRVSAHGKDVINEVTSALNQATDPLYYVSDARKLTVTFADLVSGLDLITRGAGALLKHKNIKETIIVAENKLVEIGSKALSQNQYGAFGARLFLTPEEARQYVDSKQAEAT